MRKISNIDKIEKKKVFLKMWFINLGNIIRTIIKLDEIEKKIILFEEVENSNNIKKTVREEKNK